MAPAGIGTVAGADLGTPQTTPSALRSDFLYFLKTAGLTTGVAPPRFTKARAAALLAAIPIGNCLRTGAQGVSAGLGATGRTLGVATAEAGASGVKLTAAIVTGSSVAIRILRMARMLGVTGATRHRCNTRKVTTCVQAATCGRDGPASRTTAPAGSRS